MTALTMTDQSNTHDMKLRPIAVFDSGVGGISVLQHIHALLPNEQLLYVADSLHAPYGNKSPQEIQSRCINITDFLISKNAKAIVVACNTATAAAIDMMREKYTLPIIGMEPAVKPAAEASRNGIIGVLATTGTLKSAQFAGLLESYGRNVKVVTQACVGLVECVERGELQAENTLRLVKKYCQPLLDEGADTIVLGCTHYPFLRPLIERVVGEHITLIDTGAAVAKQLQKRLTVLDLLSSSSALADVKFWTNNPALEAQQVIEALWKQKAEVSFL
ncbi:MAG: glutamate racemase [Methylotenera sp.]|uniref:glutamate racemase n=1 Tax=Methylotenera sp. TaxID=2051956 RepID=UPI002725CCB4|nr:glutamate racemase [Methylotenera sp.]MDO9150457.1 glutamate racemase [Methylotenera sp.]